MENSVELSLGGQEYVVVRARLGLYLTLETLQSDLAEAVKEDGSGTIADVLFRYLSASIQNDFERGIFGQAPWYETINAFIRIASMNAVRGEFAILKHSKSSQLSVPWNHPERLKISWIHIIAKAYNWTRENIENLWIEEALGFIQEIEADEQTNREFLHSLSDVAYPYDEASKKSKYTPLQRPLWMVVRDEESVKTRIDRRLLPIGPVHHIDGTVEEYEAVS
jgi:hypothetical protein